MASGSWYRSGGRNGKCRAQRPGLDLRSPCRSGSRLESGFGIKSPREIASSERRRTGSQIFNNNHRNGSRGRLRGCVPPSVVCGLQQPQPPPPPPQIAGEATETPSQGGLVPASVATLEHHLGQPSGFSLLALLLRVKYRFLLPTPGTLPVAFCLRSGFRSGPHLS